MFLTGPCQGPRVAGDVGSHMGTLCGTVVAEIVGELQSKLGRGSYGFETRLYMYPSNWLHAQPQ